MSSVEMRCPICRMPTTWTGNDFRPFCSERCRLVDLGSWAAESYRIPSEGALQKTQDDQK